MADLEPEVRPLVRPLIERMALANFEDAEIATAVDREVERLAAEAALASHEAEETEAPPARVLEPLLPWQPFPVAALPGVVRRYVAEIAAALPCDPSMPALAALVTIAGVVGNRRRVLLKRAWSEPAVLWAAIIARSGRLKSPAIGEVTRHIRKCDAREIQSERERREAFELNLQAWGDAPKGKRGERPVPPVPAARLRVSDITVEALADRLAKAPAGLLLVRDELAAWLRGFDRYRGGRGGDAQAFLEMHRAGSIVVDRKSGHPLSVPRAALSIVGSVQPDVLRDALGSEHMEDGLAARLLLAMPPERPKAWSEADISEGARDKWADLLDRLRALPFAEAAATGDDEARPVDLSLTPEAKAAFVAFYTEHNQLEADAETDAVAAVYSKLEGAAARLALLVALARDPTAHTVDATAMEAGIELVRWFRHEAERVYSAFTETPEGRERRRLAEWVAARGGTCTPRELAKGLRRYGDSITATTALEGLVYDRLGTWEPVEPGPNGGRPTMRFRIAAGVGVTETSEADGETSSDDETSRLKGGDGETIGISKPGGAPTGGETVGETDAETLAAGGFGYADAPEVSPSPPTAPGENIAAWRDDL